MMPKKGSRCNQRGSKKATIPIEKSSNQGKKKLLINEETNNPNYYSFKNRGNDEVLEKHHQ
jgi:hypothetical protein